MLLQNILNDTFYELFRNLHFNDIVFNKRVKLRIKNYGINKNKYRIR